jgi:hypothetical protein
MRSAEDGVGSHTDLAVEKIPAKDHDVNGSLNELGIVVVVMVDGHVDRLDSEQHVVS